VVGEVLILVEVQEVVIGVGVGVEIMALASLLPTGSFRRGSIHQLL